MAKKKAAKARLPVGTRRKGRKKAAQPVGRPRRLTNELRQQVIAIIATGGSRKMAAKYVGVTHQTIANEADRNHEFLTRLEQAESGCELFHIRKVRSNPGWQSSAWFLARKYPDQWAEVTKVAETDAQGRNLTDTQRKRCVHSILRDRFGDRAAFLTDPADEPADDS